MLYVIVLLLAALGYMVWQLRKEKNSSLQFRNRYFKLVEASHTYLFEYDVQADVLKLSQACAELLHLPVQIQAYQQEIKNVSDPLAQRGIGYLEKAMHVQGQMHELRIERQDKSLGVFHVFGETFYDADDKPVYVMGLFTDVTAEFRQQERLTTRAQMDSLTKVFNAGACRKQVAEFVEGHEGQTQAAFIILDVDHFKEVNDELGHQAGDKVLQIVARTLKVTLRQTDFIGRLGGDEFCIYLGQVPSAEFVSGLCSRLNKAAAQVLQEQFTGKKITLSIGAAMVKAGDTFEVVYQRADEALYSSKRLGRDTYSVF